jgi:hypothetical protein
MTYLIVRLIIILIPVVVAQVLILIFVVLEVLHVTAHTLELTSLAGEPVDGTGNELLLDVLTELVVELQALLEIQGVLVLLIEVGRGLGGSEEVEEAFRGNSALDDTGLLGVCS